MNANPEYIAVSQTIQAELQAAPNRTAEQRQAANQAMKRVVEIMERYDVYRRDSLRLSLHQAKPLVQLLDSIYQSPTEALERKAANRSRIVLDGTLIQVRVSAGGTVEKDFVVHSPSAASHPLLYRLLHETLLVYRQARPNTFLDQRYTSGY